MHNVTKLAVYMHYISV